MSYFASSHKCWCSERLISYWECSIYFGCFRTTNCRQLHRSEICTLSRLTPIFQYNFTAMFGLSTRKSSQSLNKCMPSLPVLWQCNPKMCDSKRCLKHCCLKSNKLHLETTHIHNRSHWTANCKHDNSIHWMSCRLSIFE